MNEILYQYTCVLLGICSIVNGLELISLKDFKLKTLTQSKDLKYKHFPAIKYILYLQIVFSVLLIISSMFAFEMTQIFSLWALFLIILYVYKVKSIGRDGSDQLRLICFGILSLCTLLETSKCYQYSILFIAIQVIISYFTSGMSKLSSKHWRKGDVLSKILNNYTYGSKKISLILSNNSLLNRFFTFTPILLMVTFPFTFVSEDISFLLVSLTSLFLFHLGTSILMGLNDFIFTFPSTYPCLIGLHIMIYN